MLATGTAIAFLLLILAGVPLAGWRSTRHFAAGALPITREHLYVEAMATQLFLFFIGSVTASANRIALWSAPVSISAYAAAALLLAVMLLALGMRWPYREPASKARLYSMLPRNWHERVPYIAVCAGAGIAEEVVYRGVLTTLLTPVARSFVVAALISAAVFGTAHFVQGWRAVFATALIGLGLQALVAFGHSLLPAMIVHALYDWIAGLLIPRWYEASPSSAA